MARLVLALALVAVGSAQRMRPKQPTDGHKREMQTRLAAAATHVLTGGPSDEKLHRVQDMIELHGGFVTDMVREYRPSLMQKWIEKAQLISGLMGDVQTINEEGRRLATGSCFTTHGKEWGCIMESCACDRAMTDSVSSGPDISTQCDDSSEYSSYACDVSMLQLECKINADATCVGATQDDWVMNFFTNGTSASLIGPGVVDVESGSDPCAGTDTTDFSQMCCGATTCAYYDDTCASDPTMCGVFKKNLVHEAHRPASDTAPPSMAPTFSSCDGYVSTKQASTGIFTTDGGAYRGARTTDAQFATAYTYTTAECPTFAMGVSTTSPPVVDGAAAVGGSVILALGAAAGVLALVL